MRNNFNQHIGPEKANEAGIFCFSRQFSFCFQVFHFIPIIIRKDFLYEHEKAENSVLIKIVLIYRGSAYGSNRRKNRGEVYTK